MKTTITLIAKLGLFGRRTVAPDAFDLRLQRIGRRENRSVQARVLFKARLTPQEV